MPAANFRETSPYADPTNKVTSFFVTSCFLLHAARVTQTVESPCPYWLTLSLLCVLIVLFSTGLFFCNACKGRILRWRKHPPMRNLMAIAPCPPMRPGKPRYAAKPAFRPLFRVVDPCRFARQSASTNVTRSIPCIRPQRIA